MEREESIQVHYEFPRYQKNLERLESEYIGKASEALTAAGVKHEVKAGYITVEKRK